MTDKADVVIVGGGVVGTSIAYHLAQRQFGRIKLLERDSLGCGSTGRSVASIDALTFQPSAVELYARSFDFFKNCEQLLGTECGFVQTGSIVLAGPIQEHALQEAVTRMKAAGVDVRMLNLTELSVLEPAANLEGLTVASFSPQAGYADPAFTTMAFAKAAQRLGVEIQTGCSVLELRQNDNHVTQVKTDCGLIEASIVVVAAGPWSGQLFPSFGVELDFQPVRHPVVCFQRPEELGIQHHSIIDLVNGIYARPETGGLTLIGSLDTNVGYDPADPDDDHGRVSSAYTLWAAERFIERYPLLEAGVLCKGWSGMMMISPDWQPVIGELPDFPGIFCATGFSGRGFQISPAVGELLAGQITGELDAIRLLSPFRPSRFVENQLTQSSHGKEELGLFG